MEGQRTSKFRSNSSDYIDYVHALWLLGPAHRGQGICQSRRVAVGTCGLLGWILPGGLTRPNRLAIVCYLNSRSCPWATGIGLVRIRKNDDYATRISQSC